jgi:hypothetical protein
MVKRITSMVQARRSWPGRLGTTVRGGEAVFLKVLTNGGVTYAVGCRIAEAVLPDDERC